MTDDFHADIALLARIEAVPTILEVVCRTTGMGFAAVARVTEDRWVACSVRDEIQFGLEPGGELRAEITICSEVRDKRQAVVINNVAEDPVFCGHPAPAMYGFQSYISMPIVLPNGDVFGTLCALDPRPARVNTPEAIGMFKLFADLIAFHLDAHQRLATSEATLLTERESAELREQFIAVLGHDLRNPLAAIDAGSRLLLRMPQNDKAKAIIARIGTSVDRMAALIDNMLDFARGRLGSSLTLEPCADEPLRPVLEQIIAELQTAWPDRVISADIVLSGMDRFRCDRIRIGQLLSNLLANALTHGAANGRVLVQAASRQGTFELSVANQGDPIPDAIIKKLFQPFFRAAARPSQQGLGLGLYIASEIAKAHGGTLDVASSAEETRFTFRMLVS